MSASPNLLRRAFAYATSATGIYLASSVLAKAGAIVLIPLYTRKLSVEEFGDYALAQTMALICPVFLSLGTMAAVGTFYFLGEDVEASRRKSGGAARASILVTLVTALLTQLGILAFGQAGQGLDSTRTLSCVLWAGVGTLFGGVPGIYYRAQQRPLRAAGYQLFQFLSAVGAAYLFVVVMARGVDGAIEALTFAGVATGTVGLVFTLVVMPGRLSLPLLRETMKFSLPFVPHYASMQITSISDRWVMKGAARSFDLGSYSLATSATGPIGMVLGAWNEAESPRMGELMRAGGKHAVHRNFARTLLGYALVTIVPGLLLIASLPLLKYVVGDRFEGALWSIPIILGLMVLDTPFSPCINVFSYFERTKVIPAITLTCSLLQLVANLLLIPRWGTAGALAARGIANVIRSSVMIRYAYQTMARSTRPPGP